jgi:hypothetical protein
MPSYQHRRIPEGRAKRLRVLLCAGIWSGAWGAFGQTVDFKDSRVAMAELAFEKSFQVGRVDAL